MKNQTVFSFSLNYFNRKILQRMGTCKCNRHTQRYGDAKNVSIIGRYRNYPAS